MKKALLRFALPAVLAAVGFLAYIGLYGWNIRSAAYEPPAPPEMTGVLAENDRLSKAEVFAKGRIAGGEDVAVDRFGRIYSGSVVDGKIYRVTLDEGTEKVEVFADVGVMPVGLRFDSFGNLIVCHHPKGLLSIDPEGTVTTLTDSVEGRKFGFTDDLDIASDGKIYFSDATTRFTGIDGNLGWEYEVMDSRPYGRLLVWDPMTGQTSVLLRDLYFANGIALSKEEDYVLVAETFRTRIIRFWLKGPKAGTSELFADNLPGYPDGVLGDGKGGFWVALPTRREWIAEVLQPRPFLKNIVTALPKSIWLRPKKYGFVIRLDENGAITESLQDPSGSLFYITNAVESNGYLYLATLKGDSLARISSGRP